MQAPLVMVHTNKLFPIAKLLTALFAELAIAIVAAPKDVQIPVPGAGKFPAKVLVVTAHKF